MKEVNMKKFMKGCAITALILILVGLILGVTGTLGQGASHFSLGEMVDAVTGGRVSDETVDRWSSDVTEQIQEKTENVHYELDDTMEFDENYPVQEGTIGGYDLGTKDSGITGLEMEAGGCSVTLKNSEDEHFYVEAEGMRKFQGYVDGNELVIRGTAKYSTNSWNGSITLYLPSGYRFQEVDLELGAGKMIIEEMQADDFSAEVGAGQLVVRNLSAYQAELDCGMGQMQLSDMQAGNVSAAVGMGSIELDGSVSGDLEADCSLGELKLTLTGKQADFNYELTCGMGELKVGDDSYSGMAQEKQIDNHADKNMQLECAMGSVKVEFQ